MRRTIQNLFATMSKLLASAALFLAITNVHSTCFFMTYQPDVPDELM